MPKKELLQYGLSILVVIGLLGMLAKEAYAEDKRLDVLCGNDRSGCVTQTTDHICGAFGPGPGALFSCSHTEYIAK